MTVYTAITGGYDTLKEDQNKEGADFVAFTDQKHSKTWEIRPPYKGFSDNNRNAKIHKIVCHEYFPKEEYTLWIDGSISLVTPMKELVDRYLGSHDIAVHRHYLRNCAYQEALVCGIEKLDDPDVISKQVSRYLVAEKYPQNNGLAECTVILRRNTPKVRELNEFWWNEIKNGSRRDQISFNYSCWKVGIEYQEMEGTVYSSKDFKWEQHQGKRTI